jgi:hypothetical protein
MPLLKTLKLTAANDNSEERNQSVTPRRGWVYFQARLAFTMATFNAPVQWHGLRPTASGFVPLSIAEFSL